MANRSETPGSVDGGLILLRRLDQAAIAVVLGGSLCAIGASCWLHGMQRGGTIEIERAAPQHIRFQLDINQADWPELSLLPGVGEVLAHRIVDSRRQLGPFVDHDDLRRVPGIGPKTLQEMKPHLLPLPRAVDVAER